jgi:hypothetical protein
VLPWTSALAVALFAAGLYLGLVGSPGDYQQGQSVRIMYVHVPAARMALFVYKAVTAATPTFCCCYGFSDACRCWTVRRPRAAKRRRSLRGGHRGGLGAAVRGARSMGK